MESITLNACAKINLYLDITDRRHDGYHLLETVMHSVSLCDIVSINTASDGISVKCSDESIPSDGNNTAYRAAAAFFEETGIKDRGVGINIEKNIPSQAGMGGGSADGAAVLKGMNMLFGSPFSDNELMKLGVRIGADIPFCIMGGCGFCTGIGDVIEPLPPLDGIAVIGKGSGGISTADGYARIDKTRERIGMTGVYEFFKSRPSVSASAPYCRNIFESVCGLEDVFNIKKIMLENGAAASCMTGSGSAVFGLFEDIMKANAAKAGLTSRGYYAEICRLISAEQCFPKGYDDIL
ncbi:MAG: 4-(cytidine 5'-diphospho)-2-C-methyl-D-erythritol kinase [Ruminococcus sp.]|nr:4-(cytidine 5'-diphospho)-2-C-methyl-D-erythritol kinase [Ruminococcus sp.]